MLYTTLEYYFTILIFNYYPFKDIALLLLILLKDIIPLW